jgi:hypothetical protein
MNFMKSTAGVKHFYRPIHAIFRTFALSWQGSVP